MSLRHALLGLLAERPSTGYDLTRVFEASLQRFAWHARHSQIYPELNKLADEGLVAVIGSGPRNSRTFDLTEAGRAELHRWLVTPPGSPQVRNEAVLRMFLLTTLPPDEAKQLLRGYAEEGAQVEQMLIGIRKDHDSPEAVLEFGQLAAEFGLRYFRMQQEWAAWAIARLDEVEQVRRD